MNTEQLSVFFDNEAEFCGCGDPGEAARMMMHVLAMHPLYEHRDALEARLPDSGVRYFILYRLESLGLTEHGGNVAGGWLTNKGREVLAALQAEAADDFESLFEVRCIHGYLVEDMGDHACN